MVSPHSMKTCTYKSTLSWLLMPVAAAIRHGRYHTGIALGVGLSLSNRGAFKSPGNNWAQTKASR
jgi:hypothetical protein